MAYVVDWEIEPIDSPVLHATAAGSGAGAGWDRLLPSPPGGVCVTRSGAVVVTEPDADQVRWIGPGGGLTVGGIAGFRDGTATSARFRHPLGVAAAPDGSVVVADTDNHAIRRIDPDGQVHTLAGSVYGEGDGPGGQARFRYPSAVAVAGDGTVLVTDTVSNTIRRIGLDGQVSTVAGHSYGKDGLGWARLSFRRPEAAVAGRDGSVIVADTGNDRIVRIERSGTWSRVAGRRASGLAPGTAADLRWPTGLLHVPDGTLYVTDAGGNAIRRIDRSGEVTALPSDPGWRPVALALLPDRRILAAETHWSPRRSIGRLRTLPLR